MSGVIMLHFLKDRWKFIQIHQCYTMALKYIDNQKKLFWTLAEIHLTKLKRFMLTGSVSNCACFLQNLTCFYRDSQGKIVIGSHYTLRCLPFLFIILWRFIDVCFVMWLPFSFVAETNIVYGHICLIKITKVYLWAKIMNIEVMDFSEHLWKVVM